MKDKPDSPVFKFDKNDITRHIQYELRVMDRMEDAFNYVYSKLTGLGHSLYCKPDDTKFDLEKSKASEGKNYDWLAIGCDNIHMLIRTYGCHHTIYTKLTTTRTYGEGEKAHSYNHYRYGAFTFHTNTELAPLDKQDFLNENNFSDLDTAMPQILQHVFENHVQSLWNSVGFIRPDYVEISNVYDGESIVSVDKLIFCAEELSDKQMELFAQTDMLEMIKAVAEKQKQTEALHESLALPFDRNSVVMSVITEFPKEYSDPYYHGVGIKVREGENKTKFIDVYSLTRYYLEEVQNILA